jgi:NADPH2:quinone reductase
MATAMAVRVHETGGPEVLKYEKVTVAKPGPGEALVRQSAIGVNFIDIYHRTGLYKVEPLPAVIGMEGAGTVEAVGEGVTAVKKGDRVAYASPPPGAYAAQRVMPANRLVVLPDDISEETAAGMMLKGMTAQYLLRRTHRVVKNEPVLIHAAAGGMGLLLTQWAKHLGAVVIGTVGNAEKAKIAKEHGCDYAIIHDQQDFVAAVREITKGRGVNVVYDGIGRATFDRSLESLGLLGHLVLYGQASGPVPPFDLARLSPKSNTITRPTLFHYTATRQALEATANDLFDVVRKGAVKIEVRNRFKLNQAAEAHKALEGRQTTGSTILIP